MCVFGGSALSAGLGTLLKPIATPMTFGGFDGTLLDPLAVSSAIRASCLSPRVRFRPRRCNSPDAPPRYPCGQVMRWA